MGNMHVSILVILLTGFIDSRASIFLVFDNSADSSVCPSRVGATFGLQHSSELSNKDSKRILSSTPNTERYELFVELCKKVQITLSLQNSHLGLIDSTALLGMQWINTLDLNVGIGMKVFEMSSINFSFVPVIHLGYAVSRIDSLVSTVEVPDVVNQVRLVRSYPSGSVGVRIHYFPHTNVILSFLTAIGKGPENILLFSNCLSLGIKL